jgi:hypothetical protein
MPACNLESVPADSMEFIVAQTCEDWEPYMVNDASADSTVCSRGSADSAQQGMGTGFCQRRDCRQAAIPCVSRD